MKSLIPNKRKLWLLLFFAAGIILYAGSRLNTEFAEKVCALGIYRTYAAILSHITGLLPFSLAEILVLTLPLAAVLILVIFILKTVHALSRSREKGEEKSERSFIIKSRLINGFINLACTLGIVFFMFMIGCGTNYYRYTFTQYSGLELSKSTDEELYTLLISLAQRTNDVRARLPEDADGCFYLENSMSDLKEAARTAMKKLGEEYDVLSGYYPLPKTVLLSRGLSELNITGIYFPFTIEANVNTDIPDYSRASVMCHELSHLKGFMREDEANYISYLACTHSGDDVLIYSGLMQALILSGNALYASNPDLYFEARALYSDGVNRDLAANSAYWDQFEDTVASEVGEVMNDTYLKANNQTDGTKSYGRMVDLLLAEMKKDTEAE